MFYDWAKETTTTSTNGNLTIAAVSGLPRISAVVGLNKLFSYGIIDDATGAPIESGIGYLSDANTLVRSKVVETMVEGTFDNTSPAAVTLAAGTKRVICAPLARNLAPVLPFVGNAAGNKFVTNGCINQVTSNSAGYPFDTSGRLNIHPWKHVYGGEVDAFSLNVGTAQAGTILRLGLYDVGIDGAPGKLLIEGASSIDLSTTGFKTTTFTAQVIPPGWYYIGLLTTSTTGVIYGSSSVSGDVIVESCPWGIGQDMNVGFGGYVTGQPTTAMPVTCPALSYTANLKVPGVALRAV